MFIPLVQRVIAKHKISCPRYDSLTFKMVETTIAEEEDYLMVQHKPSRLKNRDTTLTALDTTLIKQLKVLLLIIIFILKSFSKMCFLTQRTNFYFRGYFVCN